MVEINISGIDKVVLLKALWENAKPAAFFEMSGRNPPSFDEKNASEAVKQYIDYHAGRCIKTDLSGETASPRLYDRDWGDGAFEKIVNKFRS